MDKKQPTLRAQASAIFIGNLVGTVFQFLIPALLVRIISKEDFGVFRQFQLVSGTFVAMLGMGYRSSLFYFFPIGNYVDKQKIIQQTQFLFAFSLIIFFIVFFFIGDEILVYLNFEIFTNYKLLISLFVFFTLMSSVIEIIFTLEKNTLANKLFPSLRKIFRFLTFLTVILLIPGVDGAIWAQVLFSVFLFAYFLYHMRPYFAKWYKLDKELLIKQLQYSVPFGLALILNLVAKTFDKFFINKYISPSEFAIYSISFLSIPILNQFFKSIHNVMVPEISLAMNDRNLGKATELWKKTVDKTSSIAIPAVFLFWILANEIITILYTEEYIESVKYYRIFISMFFVSMFSHEIILRGANKTKYIFVSNVISTALTVIFAFILIPRYNLYGAIWVALMGTTLPMIVSLLFEKRIMKLSFANWVNWRTIFLNFTICIVVSIPVYFLKDSIGNIFIRTILTGISFVGLVVLIQMKFKLFIFENELKKVLKRF